MRATKGQSHNLTFNLNNNIAQTSTKLTYLPNLLTQFGIVSDKFDDTNLNDVEQFVKDKKYCFFQLHDVVEYIHGVDNIITLSLWEVWMLNYSSS